jgi:hypothetical protein
MTPKLASMFALFRPSHKTDARCRRLPFTTGVWRNRRAVTARPGRRGDRITGHAIILERCDAHSTSGVGHQLPRQLTTGAAAVPLRADSKVAERRGRDGPMSDIVETASAISCNADRVIWENVR